MNTISPFRSVPDLRPQGDIGVLKRLSTTLQVPFTANAYGDSFTLRFAGEKVLKNYLLKPNHDFDQYVKEFQQRFWTEDIFDWNVDVRQNLRKNLDRMSIEEFRKLSKMVLPMVKASTEKWIAEIQKQGLPADTDKLKDIQEVLLSDKLSVVDEAVAVQMPLEQALNQAGVPELENRRRKLDVDLADLRKLKKLGLFKDGDDIRPVGTLGTLAAQHEERQDHEIATLKIALDKTKQDLKQTVATVNRQQKALKAQVKQQLKSLVPKMTADLQETLKLLERVQSGDVLDTPDVLESVKDLVAKRQFRALRDIANHGRVAEQTALAPLTMGVIRYKRYPEIQAAMTTFLYDEAKHYQLFGRYMNEKLQAKERILANLIDGGEGYLKLSATMPAAAAFVGLIVEAIGGTFFEFFGDEKNMPEPLFRDLCKTIGERDERRHMDLCAALYNEFYHKGADAGLVTRLWEELRNQGALKAMMFLAYGDKNEEHYHVQAPRAFGVEPKAMFRFIAERLSQELAKVGLYQTPEQLLKEFETPVNRLAKVFKKSEAE